MEMELLSEDDLNLKDLSPEELDRAWNLWFDLAQTTNDFDPPYTHGVFVLCDIASGSVQKGTDKTGTAGTEGAQGPSHRSRVS
jgi:hypothetical protein